MKDSGSSEGVGQEEESGAAQQPASSSLRRAFALAGLGVGLLLAVTACACGPLMLLATSFVGDGAPAGPAVQQALGLTVLGAGMGLALAVDGWHMWQGRTSRPFYPRRTWLLWAVLLPLLAAGLAISLTDLAPDYLLPPVNTLTMLVLPALILAAVGRVLGGAGGTWRDVIGAVFGGASLGTGLALVVEVSLVGLLLAGALLLGLVPGGVEGLGLLMEQLEASDLLNEPQILLELFSPVLLLLALVFLSVVVPLVEEVAKTLGVGLAGIRLRPTPARAFLLGVASGAGFALAENLLNGAIVGVIWGPGILSRLAATLMHCAAAGLTGWGWGELWTGRRPGRLALALAGAVGLHGLWNGLAAGTVVSVLVAVGRANDPAWAAVTGLVTVALMVALMFLATAALVGMLWAGRALARREGVHPLAVSEACEA